MVPGARCLQQSMMPCEVQQSAMPVTRGQSAYPVPDGQPPCPDYAYDAEEWSRIVDSVTLPPDCQLLDLLNSLDLYQDSEDSMDPMCTSDMLFPDLSSDHTHMTSGPSQAMRVSLGGEDDGLRSMLTPPESPVFAELTTPNNQPKGPMFQDGVVPNLKYEQVDSSYEPVDPYSCMNTMYSPLYQEPTSFSEGTFCDVPDGPSSNYVLAKQEPDYLNPDYFPTTGVDSAVLQWPQYTDIDDYSPAPPQPPPPFDANFDTLPNVEHFLKSLMDSQRPMNYPHRGQNSSGEETEFESESEASFTLPNSPATSDEGCLSIQSTHRTHNYQRKTIDKSLSLLHGVTSKGSKRGRGRPRKMHHSTSSSYDSDEEVTTRRGRGRREAMRGNHLWEFIRDLLKDNTFCPKYIRWEDRKDGIFRFVNSEAVAKMWGCKKNNPQMTYEKLSRAMRYYYKREILERVDGRRLVYKFGKNAAGWREAAGLDSETDST